MDANRASARGNKTVEFRRELVGNCLQESGTVRTICHPPNHTQFAKKVKVAHTRLLGLPS